MEFSHKSVLLNETVESLNIKPDGIYVDGTVGGAGHSTQIAKRLTTGRLIAFDRDPDAVAVAKNRLKNYNATVINSNFDRMDEYIKELGIEGVDGILMDLGVSSYQLDNAERGFSYHKEAPLDMRMDQRQDMTAKDIINDYSEMELYRVIRDYGEEKFAGRIASRIVNIRQTSPIKTTGELVEIIKDAMPASTSFCRSERDVWYSFLSPHV